jgi:DAACS family dicarboxylate/amino acid:cation (Na+ or H+) symporter
MAEWRFANPESCEKSESFMKMHVKLLVGLVLGIVLGAAFHAFAPDAEWIHAISKHLFTPVGQIFLRLIFMIVVPMVFSALVLGVYELGQSRGLGKVASRTLLYTIIASSASVLIGVGLVNLLKPGASFQIDSSVIAGQGEALEKIQSNAAQAKTFSESIVELVPKNPIDSAARALDGEMLALMVFALIFGVAMSVVFRGKNEEDVVLLKLLRQVFDVSMKIVEYAIRLAPYAVFAIVFNTAFRFGTSIFASLAYYVGVVVLGLAIQQFIVYSALLKYVARRSPWDFFRRCREVYLYAFSTASSNATLPRSLDCAEKELGLPANISRFVLTVGSTANQNGTALFEGITVLFLAQVYQVDLSFAQQVQVVIMSILAGIGTAGVPGGSLPLIMILLQQVGIPAEGMALVLGVDRFLDMCRTTLNVSGDLVITALVADGESVRFGTRAAGRGQVAPRS